MQYPTLFVITFCVLLYSCRGKTNQIIIAKKSTTVAVKTEDTIIPYYTFDTSKSIQQNIHLGWIDTFSIDGRHFRLYQDSNQELKVDAFINRWINNITTGDYFWGVQLEDIDKDGFVDFSYYHRRHSDIYFYNRNKKLFNTKEWHIDGSQTLLDSNKLA